jgi:TPR repeat protein
VRRFGALLAWALCAVCGCGRSTKKEQQPAPASSVISIGVALGTCDDIAVCEKECDAGSADRCRRLAATYALGQGADKDEARATALYARACDMRDAPACVFAGQMFEFAHGVPKDDTRAARFYERACDLQWAAGCYNLAIMVERGAGVPADRARAGDLYQVACTAGAKQACDKAREMRAQAFLDAAPPP